jgi:hypothetical protein
MFREFNQKNSRIVSYYPQCVYEAIPSTCFSKNLIYYYKKNLIFSKIHSEVKRKKDIFIISILSDI